MDNCCRAWPARLLSDEPLLDELRSRLAADDYRLGTAIDTIIRSPQFRMIRGRDFSEDALP